MSELYGDSDGHLQEKQSDNPTMVAVDGHHIGYQVVGMEQSFSLSNLFSKESLLLGADKFTRMYFRTVSGNIYQLNDKGELINGRLCKERDQIFKLQLSRDELMKAQITVGKEFVYDSGHTTKVMEIVSATDKMYSPASLKEITGGKRATIRDELVQMLPLTPPSSPPDESA